MEDLLQSQIQDSCKLALPEGLKDLMCDISREVLRAQPPDLYGFIVSYLEAMLLARGTLCIACQVCRDICQCDCHPELEDELRNIGLDGEDLDTVKNLITEYFDKENVKEENLLMKLFTKTEIDPNLLPHILNAVRKAFQKHRRMVVARYWEEAENSNQTGQEAAKRTMQFYERLQDDKELSWDDAATKIQSAYRGHVVRVSKDASATNLRGKLAQMESTSSGQPHGDDHEKACTSRQATNNNARLSISSISLAGSLVNLPKYIPYSIHELTLADFEERETERKNIDYTLESCASKEPIKEDAFRKIGFHEQHVLREIDSTSLEEEEHIPEEIHSDATSVEENIITDMNRTVDNFKSFHFKDTNVEYIVQTESNENCFIKIDEPQKVDKEKIKDTSFEEHTYNDDKSFDVYIEEIVEEEIHSRKNTSIVGSKAQVVMIKTLKKNLIKASKAAINYDKELEQVGSVSFSSD